MPFEYKFEIIFPTMIRLIDHYIDFSKIIHKYHLLKIVFDIHFMLQHKICLYDITDARKNSYKFSNKRPLSSLHLIYDYP